MSKSKSRAMNRVEEWQEARRYSPETLEMARKILMIVKDGSDVFEAIRKNPVPMRGNVSKHALVIIYQEMVENGEMDADEDLLARIRMKPMRTLSGVTTVTVLTGPHPCPGHCIFCPDDQRMPKSYLPDEPGAARAFQNNFDPFLQVSSRIQAYEAVGHPTDKIELLILGGSWTAYSLEYRNWFIKRCLDAMNEIDSDSLIEAQKYNENASHRNIGLTIETRPDMITTFELSSMRQLGVTKVQLGVQSLDDEILIANKRGHAVAQTLEAVSLLRAAGFKIVLHWMPNLYLATPESDRQDFYKFWEISDGGIGLCPDELKIYPTQLLENTELYQKWQEGFYQPYDTETLIDLISKIKPIVRPYCRINRVIRDIPSQYVAAGNKRSSLRMDIQRHMKENGTHCQCIRCREVKDKTVDADTLTLKEYRYDAVSADERFLQYVTPDDHLAGYLRLSLPQANSPRTGMNELDGAALIREVHIYGQSLPVGAEKSGAAQHIGLGTALIEEACRIAVDAGYKKIAVISAIGTRRYYELRGFERGEFYQIRSIG